MITPRNIYFKEGHEKELIEEYKQLKTMAQIIAEDMANFFESHGFKLILTDIISNPAEDKRLGRVSAAHSEGRAFDFRTHGIPRDFLAKVENRYENLYKDVAAIAKSTGKPNLIEYHDNGNGDHGHVQIRRDV
jgi:hypothetical protein